MQSAAGYRPNAPFPGFDGLRLVAATTVIFSHAFLIAEGSEASEPMRYWLGEGNIAGLYGVFTFFIISGFILTRSLESTPQWIRFSLNRFLRIMPGFLFCLLATSLLIGSILTPLDLHSYYLQPETYAYVASSLACLCDGRQNPFEFAAYPNLAGVKNGSLWSLSYEVLSYLFLLWLWILLRRPLFVAGAAGIVTVTIVLSPAAASVLPGIAYTLPYFASGVIMY